MRPNISEELAREVDEEVRDEVRVPPDRLTFGDRVRVLLEEYREQTERVEELEGELEEREEQIQHLNQQIQQQQGGMLRG